MSEGELKVIKIKKTIRECKRHRQSADVNDMNDWILYETKKGNKTYACRHCDNNFKEYIKRYRKERIENERKDRLRHEETLSDFYVKSQLLKGIKNNYQYFHNVPEENIQLMRETIRLKRLIKEKKKPPEEPKPIKKCNYHGDLFAGDLIKCGKSRINLIQRYRCRKCMKSMHASNYIKNRERIRERQKIYRSENPERVKETRRKSWRKCNGLQKVT